MFVFSDVNEIAYYCEIRQTLCKNSCHICLVEGPQECYTEAHTYITIFYKYKINLQTQSEIWKIRIKIVHNHGRSSRSGQT